MRAKYKVALAVELSICRRAYKVGIFYPTTVFYYNECKIESSYDISFDLSDQNACAPFKRANCTIVNKQMEMFQCFSYKRMFPSLTQQILLRL